MSIKVKFSKALYDYRKENGFSQKVFSEICDVSLRHYQELENGRSLPSLKTALRISKVIGLNLHDLEK